MSNYSKLLSLGIPITKTSGTDKTLCPKCSASRKNKKEKCLSINIDEGIFNCHNCGYKGSTKIKREQEAQQRNIQAQAQANAESAEKAAMFEVQKQQALTAEKVSIEQAKSQFDIQRMQMEATIKKELMAEEFNYKMQLAQITANSEQQKEKQLEDRKDKRIKMQGTQQSELIDQRQNDLLPKDFESSGNDTLGGFGLEEFGPR